MRTWIPMKSILLTLLFQWNANSQVSNNNDIQTSSGPVRGTAISFNGRSLKQYLGIPFAKPPVGELRFQKTQPVERRSKTIIADKMPPACIQYLEYPYPWYDSGDGQSEDCLYLNIWVPHNPIGGSLSKYPVFFWIYGGGFSVGSNRLRVYEGQALSGLGDVIVVTINYRMAVFGFLTSGTDEAPGNAAMYDMVEALKWVNKNIAAFGGDPKKVTVSGWSAGSISTGFLCVSPLTKGLFHRVIMESGSPAFLLADNNTVNVAESQKLAKAVGCADDSKTIQSNPKEVVSCLKGKDPLELAKTLNSFHPKSSRSFFPMYGDEFLPNNARKEIIKGNFHKVDVLIGNTKDESSFQITTANPEVFGFFGEKNPQINKSYGEMMLRNIFSSFDDPDAVVQHYLGNLTENEYDSVRKQVYTAASDYALICPDVYFAESYSRFGNDVHYYFFVHRPSRTPWAEWMGAVHGDELPFVFGLPLQAPQNYTLRESVLSREIIKIWTDFTKRGTTGRMDWPQYSRKDPSYMVLDVGNRTRYGQGPHKDNCDFFRGYFGFA